MSFLQLISTIASIISIPLAVYYAHKTADATSDKARLEIIKTLSYKLSLECSITYDDIASVYRSKLREHKIKKAKFDIVDIIHDLKSDIMSNAFIESNARSKMLLNLSKISGEGKKELEHNRSHARTYLLQTYIEPLLIPVLIVLIIFNVVLLLLSFSEFIIMLGYTFNGFGIEMNYLSIIRGWEDFFTFSKLFISIPCLVAWSIVIIAHKYIISKGKYL